MIKIPLSEGNPKYKDRFTIIDDCDSDLAEFAWGALLSKDSIYAQRASEKRSIPIRLHRVILARKLELDRPLERWELVDHINHDTLDNRRENLRRANKSLNGLNREAPANNTSKFKGVTFNKKSGRWKAQLAHKGKNKYLGEYKTPEEASEAYKSEYEKVLQRVLAELDNG